MVTVSLLPSVRTRRLAAPLESVKGRTVTERRSRPSRASRQGRALKRRERAGLRRTRRQKGQNISIPPVRMKKKSACVRLEEDTEVLAETGRGRRNFSQLGCPCPDASNQVRRNDCR